MVSPACVFAKMIKISFSRSVYDIYWRFGLPPPSLSLFVLYINVLFLWSPAPSAESSVSAPSHSYAPEPTVTPACSHQDLGHSHSVHNNGGLEVQEHSVIDMITATAPDTIVISKGMECPVFNVNDSKTGNWTFKLILINRKQLFYKIYLIIILVKLTQATLDSPICRDIW